MTTLYLNDSRHILSDAQGRRFDPATRRWGSPQGTPGASRAGDSISLRQAIRWLQRESEAPCRVPVGIIGPRAAEADQRAVAEEIGSGLAALGLTVLCGGREGVMEAVCRGVAAGGGLSIGLLPDDHWDKANSFVSIPLASGIGVARNAVIARASLCLVAIGGGHGTLSEIAFGLQFGRPVFALARAPQVAGVKLLANWPEVEDSVCRVVLDLVEPPQ